jgi:hypothetical protein
MIVSLDELKSALGIALNDASQDAILTSKILGATVWVQNQTHRRFDVPIPVTEYRPSPGRRSLYLRGHIDDSPAADNPSETLDPTTSLVVSRRHVVEPFRAWEVLVEGEDYERREDELVFLRMWGVWCIEDEYKLDYLDGYAVAPSDIHDLVLEIAQNQYLVDSAIATGTAGITSEKLGDFSYSTDGSAEGSTGATSISNNGRSTLSFWTRKFV